MDVCRVVATPTTPPDIVLGFRANLLQSPDVKAVVDKISVTEDNVRLKPDTTTPSG
jgi:hypothetical protein